MATYLITGATGLIGRHLLVRILRDPDAEVHALVRAQSVGRLQRALAEVDGAERVRPLHGDLTLDGLGISDEERAALRGRVDHLVHLAALYDMTADDARNDAVNIEGTRRVVELAEDLRVGVLHHVSSVAVAGEAGGVFSEDDFDRGQPLPSPYHRTKFESERIVREAAVPWRVYRPAIVLGDSHTGEMDKIDGPYYFFPTIAFLAQLPGPKLPLVAPDLGASNAVPVDYVADAMAALIVRPGLDRRAFHLVNPAPQKLTDVYNAFARVAGAPQVIATLPAPGSNRLLHSGGAVLGRIPGLKPAFEMGLKQLRIPPEIVRHSTFTCTFASDATRAELAEAGVAPPPPLANYAHKIWNYWAEHLDPYRFRRPRPGGPLDGRVVAITGASSGIGRAAAIQVAARGGIPLLLARRTEELEKVRDEIVEAGGQAYVYSVDLTSQESVDAVVKQMLADHGGVDMLVNNAGRSIRRSLRLSYDRFHDFERTMALNYFAPVRLILALMPSMSERRFGHIVNVSSIGVQAYPPRFSAYVASKAALDAFSRVAQSEVLGDGISFTNVHMPLVRTPMIAPTKIYDRFPTLTPEEAGEVIVRALEQRPKQWGTRLGTFAAVANVVAPRLTDAVLHTAYLAFPDSAAAQKGKAADPGEQPANNAPEALSRGAVVLARLLPGVHW
jgi:NAD(P)-dependent dehydrogenase (short-subunit alcohol dehydrogenase family)